jgi:hypothetical protein
MDSLLAQIKRFGSIANRIADTFKAPLPFDFQNLKMDR